MPGNLLLVLQLVIIVEQNYHREQMVVQILRLGMSYPAGQNLETSWMHEVGCEEQSGILAGLVSQKCAPGLMMIAVVAHLANQPNRIDQRSVARMMIDC